MKEKKEMNPTNSRYILVKKSKIHGTGIFSKCKISKGTKIIPYVGKKVTKKESEKIAEERMDGTVYLFYLNRRYDLDGSVLWNTARYINHSCDPNCESIDYDGEIWICAKRKIKKEEELSYDYGFDSENYKDHPCRCGAKNCRSYIISKKEAKKIGLIKKKKKKHSKKKSKEKKH